MKVHMMKRAMLVSLVSLLTRGQVSAFFRQAQENSVMPYLRCQG